ncbi:E3 ubiquitin-protein ligase ORTHRUS 2-like [Apium graveolens]|uniref:E3 ubiquitin-protein ligase ORTHRUS 2-like n=1 Tax=Apium graveolens TaxID=4045 RepID=UPI003D798E1A
MAQQLLPCDGDGNCMVCKIKAATEEIINCKTCVTPWHLPCLSGTTLDAASAADGWDCPDCDNPVPIPIAPTARSDLIASIRAIESDSSLTDQDKAIKRQQLLSGSQVSNPPQSSNPNNHILQGFICSFCMQLPDRPITTPCGHNFCLKCFQKWVGQGKRTCVNCRLPIPPKMASNPRINSSLVVAIRMAKMSNDDTSKLHPKVCQFIHNQDRPDQAYTTERAIKSGKANACSGKIFVTVPPDHFGPILAENDPQRNQGVLVGETWVDRLECRQWGAHLPHVAGISGQSYYGAQSVALSGGYEDDEDHGEWFLYTGSGGRDLSGNKRTNKTQSFDQKFEKQNESLRVSCRKGYPVRVVRSHKEKRSSYAPESGVRYDGIYRIEKCWRKPGIQGFKVCRYLFVRCDNDPAPWTSDDHGDHPRPLPDIEELKRATDITERKGTPCWDFDSQAGIWKWSKPPPESRKQAVVDGKGTKKIRHSKQTKTIRERLLKEFSCLLCKKIMVMPLTTPCAHNFCKSCLEGAFAGQTFIRQRVCEGRRTLRAQKNIMKCPSCSADISDFLRSPQVNRELMHVIDSLKRQSKEIDGDEENVDLDEEIVDAEEKHSQSAEENDATDGLIKDKEIYNIDSEIPKCDEIENQSPTKSPSKPQTHKNNKRKNLGNDDTIPEVSIHPNNTQKNCKGGARDAPETTICTNVQASPIGRKLKGSEPEKNDADTTCSSNPPTGVQTRGKKKKLVES